MAVFSNALPFTLLAWGQRQVTSGFAGITMAVVPLLVLPLAHVFVPGERLTPRKAAGFAIGFAGVVVLIGTGGTEPGDAPALARLACVAASACYAIGAIVTRLAPSGSSLAFGAGAPARRVGAHAAARPRRRGLAAGPAPRRARGDRSTSASSRRRSPR